MVGDDGKVKVLSDLWMHQNRRMWDRLQLAATLQAGLLGAAYFLTNDKWPTLTIVACLVAMVATGALIHITSVDRAIRNKYRDELISLGISVGFDRENPDDLARYNAVSFGILNFLDSKFYVNCVLVSLMALDLAAVPVLLSKQV
jgi:hypothetical protein